MTACVRWSKKDALHFRGLCTNSLKLETPPDSMKGAPCIMCPRPVDMRTGSPGCHCPLPKTYRNIHYLRVVRNSGTPGCEQVPMEGDYVIYGTCGGFTLDPMIAKHSVFGTTCYMTTNPGRWSMQVSGAPFGGGGSLLIKAATLRYNYLIDGVSGTQVIGPFSGAVPWCTDMHGSQDFSGGVWTITLSTDPFL